MLCVNNNKKNNFFINNERDRDRDTHTHTEREREREREREKQTHRDTARGGRETVRITKNRTCKKNDN